MGKIYAFQPKGRQKDIPDVMNALVRESSEAKSFMHIIERADGSVSFGISGGFADRLQFAAFALVKMLDSVTDRISESNSVGYTESVNYTAELPRRPLPRGLKSNPRSGPSS